MDQSTADNGHHNEMTDHVISTSTESKSTELPRDVRQSRKRERLEDDSMDCTSKTFIQNNEQKKQATIATKDGAVLCHSLADDIAGWSQIDVAREITRCLQEPKFHLVKDVVDVLGIQRAIEIFHKTATIQETGGQLAADGDGVKKKSPGGVYFALVKTNATSDEKKQIFRRDNLQKERRRKAIKRKKDRAKQMELTKRKADWELNVFRAQLEHPLQSTAELEWNVAHKLSSECDTTYTEVKRRPKNIHKRLGTDKDGTIELMEVECSDNCSTNKQESVITGNNGSHDDDIIQAEKQAAEQFELMADCNMDFALDLT